MLCLSVLPFSCRRETSAAKKQPADSAGKIQLLRPCLRVAGYEENIDLRYGVPMDGLAVTGVRYQLGNNFPPVAFLHDLQEGLAVQGWRPLKYTLSNPATLVGDTTAWAAHTTELGSSHMWEQAWKRDSQLLHILGMYYTDIPPDSVVEIGVYVTLSAYKADYSKQMLADYETMLSQLSTDSSRPKAERSSGP